MIRSLTLENYRGFQRFELHDLGRVNLMVGTNNSGKTSVLEAIHALESVGEFEPIRSALMRRGEEVTEVVTDRPVQKTEARRLFHGHKLAPGSRFRIGADTSEGGDELTAVVEAAQDGVGDLFNPFASGRDDGTYSGPDEPQWGLGLRWRNGRVKGDHYAWASLYRGDGLLLSKYARSRTGHQSEPPPPVRFITTASLAPQAVVELFDEIVLTPAEDFTIKALRIIEPAVERIATGGAESRGASLTRVGGRGGFLVRFEGAKDRIPIGSLGDGIWRLLGLALSLSRSESGILLIDEIDTGLHYSVMERMWKLLYQTAKEHDIQVFATTHSRDCYESLAAVCRDDVTDGSDVTIQRIERGKTRSVAYTEREIAAAAERGIEVR